MKDKKSTGNTDVSWHVLKLLGEDSFTLLIQLISNIIKLES